MPDDNVSAWYANSTQANNRYEKYLPNSCYEWVHRQANKSDEQEMKKKKHFLNIILFME